MCSLVGRLLDNKNGSKSVRFASLSRCRLRYFLVACFVTNACHPPLKIWLLNADRFMVLFDASSFAPFSGLSQLHLSASTLCKLEAPELKGC